MNKYFIIGFEKIAEQGYGKENTRLLAFHKSVGDMKSYNKLKKQAKGLAAFNKAFVKKKIK